MASPARQQRLLELALDRRAIALGARRQSVPLPRCGYRREHVKLSQPGGARLGSVAVGRCR